MEAANTITTWEALKKLGFEEDPDVVFSDVLPGLSYDFKSFKLQAACLLSLRMVEVVSFSGVLATSRTISEIDFEMPRQVESIEQCAAWIAWQLNQILPHHEKVIPVSRMEWLILGMRNQDSLPWEQNMAAYRVRPQCCVERSWLRQALKSIKENVKEAEPNSRIVIGFDGRVLLFQGENWVVPTPAIGDPWLNRYEIKVCDFYFPSRLMQEVIHVSVWKENLTLGNRLYRGITVAGATPSTAGVSDSNQSHS